MTWYGLRQQTEKQVDAEGQLRPSRCLADFVAPKDSGIADYAGLFAVTAGIGSEKKEKEFLDALDDYSSIMFKSLADRLAEAFAECLHQRVRKDLWGYAADEALDNEALIKEQYQGIRPAPGYPACPDHTPKIDLFKALRTDEIGMQPDREPGHAPGLQRQRLLPGPPAGQLLQRGHDWRRSGARHGPAPGHGRGRTAPPPGPQPGVMGRNLLWF